MEYALVIMASILVVYLSSTKWMRDLQFKYAVVVFLVCFPVLFYMVVLRDFSYFKLALFLIVLIGSLYNFLRRKAQLKSKN